ncbi:MAG: S-methyl-5'-thioadenosine phosphorylase [Dehalococcoidia bacterium]|jgi:5'-methylthioadenosine phosphorylase|nr:S-methyl-5'-thioadenosine phosphorylase [Dehalococcoidia bacterium]
MPEATIAFIGGSGMYDLAGLVDREELIVSTPFGAPSGPIVLGSLEGVPLAFIARHGAEHSISPSEIPARANVYALKDIGVERIVSITAVGSLRHEIRPRDVVVPDQIIDRTKGRPSTFFENGIVAHVAFADPFCPVLSGVLADVSDREGGSAGQRKVHAGGTYVAMEGPQFSTRAESRLYQSWQASIIGMTALPEAKLAREAEICYATLAFATDYDVWHESEDDVTIEVVVQHLMANIASAKRIISGLVRSIPSERNCVCESALRDAIITNSASISEEARLRLGPILQRYPP